MEEHGSSKPLVGGSSPSGGTKCWVRIGGQFTRLSIWREEFKPPTQYNIELSTNGQVTALSRQKFGFNSQ